LIDIKIDSIAKSIQIALTSWESEVLKV